MNIGHFSENQSDEKTRGLDSDIRSSLFKVEMLLGSYGSFSSGDRKDYYAITPQFGAQTLMFTTDSSNASSNTTWQSAANTLFDVQVVDSFGNIFLKSQDFYTPDLYTRSIDFVSQSFSDTYYVEITNTFSNSFNYVLSMIPFQPKDDDFAANIASTGTIGADGFGFGVLEAKGDQDWFQVDMLAGRTYSIGLRPGIFAGAEDPYLYLYDSIGVLIAKDDDSGVGANSLLNYTVTQSGRYFLGAGSGIAGTGLGSYILDLSVSKIDDYPANKSTTGAVAVGGVAPGNLEANGDRDWFSVNLTAGQQYTFSLDASGQLDPFLSLYTNAGTLIFSDDDSGTGFNSQFNYTAASTGTYYLAASAGSEVFGTGGYALHAAASASNLADDYSRDPTTKGRMSLGAATQGQIEKSGDADWFAIDLVIGQQYTFDLNSYPINGLPDPYLSIYANNGTVLASNDDSYLGLGSHVSFIPASSGTYYLAASSGGNGTGTGAYMISMPVLAELSGTMTATEGARTAGKLNRIDGNDLDNVIIGNSAVNDFYAQRGNDVLIGGLGIDMAHYSGSHDNFSIAATLSGFTVADKIGDSGLDALTGIERLDFVSGNHIALDLNGNAGQVFRVYQAAFDRKPDFVGLGYWINDMDNKGSSLTTIAAGFFQSPEFKNLYGGSNPDNVTLITNLYHNVLHRTPDQAGFNYWQSELDSGKISRAGVLASFAESTENQAQVIGSIQNGIEYTFWPA